METGAVPRRRPFGCVRRFQLRARLGLPWARLQPPPGQPARADFSQSAFLPASRIGFWDLLGTLSVRIPRVPAYSGSSSRLGLRREVDLSLQALQRISGEALPVAGGRGEPRPRDADVVRSGHPARVGGARSGGAAGVLGFPAHFVASLVCISPVSVHRFTCSRAPAVCWPPRADQIHWSARLLARA